MDTGAPKTTPPPTSISDFRNVSVTTERKLRDAKPLFPILLKNSERVELVLQALRKKQTLTFRSKKGDP